MCQQLIILIPDHFILRMLDSNPFLEISDSDFQILRN